MPTGVTLADLNADLLAETNQSLNVAHGINVTPIYKHMLKRVQEELWMQFEWPHLKMWRDVTLVAGQRFYPYPAGMPFDAINHFFYKLDPTYQKMDYGISPDMYALYGGENGRSWPARRWQNVPTYDVATGLTAPDAQFEVWPGPDRTGIIRIQGQAPLNPLIADTDRCVLDSTLIVLFAAAEILTNQKSEGASAKNQKAQQYLRRLLANQGANKRKMYQLSATGGSTSRTRATPWLDYIPGP